MIKRNLVMALLGLLAFCGRAASACGTGPTSINWGTWRVSSSEKLYSGYVHTSYPLTYLFDDDPRTAWVFSGTGKCWRDGETGFWKSRYAVLITPVAPLEVDEVRIMNGYNRSRALFQRNNRVVQMKISADGAIDGNGGSSSKLVKTVALKDSMGWHSVSIPRRRLQSLMLSFIGIKRGRDNDVCVSGIELYNRGRKIDMRMPKAVHFDAGGIDDGCRPIAPYRKDSHLLSVRDNVPLVRNDWYELGMQWSPSGRFACSSVEDSKGKSLWVADAEQGKVIYRAKMPVVKNFYLTGVRWLGRGKLALVYWDGLAPSTRGKRRTVTRTIKFI